MSRALISSADFFPLAYCMLERDAEHVTIRSQLDPDAYKKERAARLKMDIQILPVCVLLYLLAYIDKSNISQAMLDGKNLPNGKVEDPGILTSLNMTPHEFSIALTVLFPTYMAFQLPSNLIIRKIGPRIWIPTLALTWGVVETLQGLVTSKAGLYINRIFLGLAEAGLTPGITLLLTFFYVPKELQFRQAFYFTGASLSGSFSGLLATALRKMDGISGQHGWQWVFYIEGIFTVAVAIVCYFIIPNGPRGCFMLSPLERELIIQRQRAPTYRYQDLPHLTLKLKEVEFEPTSENEGLLLTPPWYKEVLRTFTDERVYLTGILGFCVSLPIFSFTNFMPSIIKGMGDYSTAKSMLLSCPPFAASFVYSLCMAFVADRLQLRYLSVMLSFIITLVGLAVLWGCDEPMHRYGGIFMVAAGSYSGPPCMFAWMANNSAGYYKRTSALAFVHMMDNASGLVAAWLFNTHTEAPRFLRGTATNLAITLLGMVVATIQECRIWQERRQRACGRRDECVVELYRRTHWPREALRSYLGDRHPEFLLEL